MLKYRIDPNRSRVWIHATSSLHPINSETDGAEGWFEAEFLAGNRLNPSVTPNARLEVAIDELSSGNPLYDREMRRRIDTRRNPSIVGNLTSMKETDDPGTYIVGGDIVFRGITKTYEDKMTLVVQDDTTLILEGEKQFDMRDFGMDPPKILTLRVHPEVTVRVRIVATKAD